MKDKSTHDVPFTIENFDILVKKYNPLINKFAYLFYQKYFTVIEVEDARQEILLCFFRCLTSYDQHRKVKFMTYFYTAQHRLMSRYYYSYFHTINISRHRDEFGMATDGKRVIGDNDASQDDIIQSAERFINEDSHMKTMLEYDMKIHLSKPSQKVYDIYIKHHKFNPWLVSKKLGLSRWDGKKVFDNFKKEMTTLAFEGI